MMTGIEVLNSWAEMSIQAYWWVCIIVWIVIFLASAAISIIYEDGCMGTIAGFIIGLMIAAIIVCVTAKEVPTGKTIYQVTISDSVNFKDFNEKYEIIEQDGKIYTIKERDN